MNYIKAHSVNGRAGHQLAEWNTALALSEFYGMKFIHTPLNGGWEDKLRFGEGEAKINEINFKKKIELPKFDRSNIEEIRDIIEDNDDTLFILAKGQNLEGHFLTEDRLKRKYRNSPINKPFTENPSIGVHIRRGDVTKKAHPNRWVDNEFYVNIIDNYLKEYKGYEIHIFSEGNPDMFKEFKKYDPYFHLSKDKFDTFNKMVKCDALITGKSGYSYFASIISEGHIFAIPFWHSYPNKKRITILG